MTSPPNWKPSSGTTTGFVPVPHGAPPPKVTGELTATAPLTLSPTLCLDAAKSPVVVVGPNGAGKSTFGVDLAVRGARRINAQRATGGLERVGPQPLDDARTNRKQLEIAVGRDRIGQAGDLGAIIGELWAADLYSGYELKRRLRSSPESKASKAELASKLANIAEAWNELFPGRHLSFEGGACLVHRDGFAKPYFQGQMSDGERQALYLIAKTEVVDDDVVVVVDEPEIHLHPLLARRLWDGIERRHPMNRFIYVTHDLLFALSRASATILSLREDGALEEIGTDIVAEVAVSILGAASLPTIAARIFFCEGSESSLDRRFLTAWFKSADTAVIAVGGCDRVEASVDGYRALKANRAVATGIVDRDARCDAEISALSAKGIHVLPVGEVESLYCVEGVFRAVARQLGTKEPDLDATVANLESALQKRHQPKEHVHALDFARDEVRWTWTAALGKISPGAGLGPAQGALDAAVKGAATKSDPAVLFPAAHHRVTTLLAGKLSDLLKLPGKDALGCAAGCLGVDADVYVGLVLSGLRGDLGADRATEMEAALAPLLPPR